MSDYDDEDYEEDESDAEDSIREEGVGENQDNGKEDVCPTNEFQPVHPRIEFLYNVILSSMFVAFILLGIIAICIWRVDLKLADNLGKAQLTALKLFATGLLIFPVMSVMQLRKCYRASDFVGCSWGIKKYIALALFVYYMLSYIISALIPVLSGLAVVNCMLLSGQELAGVLADFFAFTIFGYFFRRMFCGMWDATHSVFQPYCAAAISAIPLLWIILNGDENVVSVLWQTAQQLAG